MSTFVTVGNATQPFDRLLRAVETVADALPKPIHVQHGVTTFSIPGCTGAPFMAMDEFAERIRGASLLIMHAGAGSLMHALDAGHVPIIMPREARYGEIVDDHQVELAEALARTDRVIVARAAEQLAGAVAQSLKRRAEPGGARVEPPLVGLVRAQLEAYAAEREHPRPC